MSYYESEIGIYICDACRRIHIMTIDDSGALPPGWKQVSCLKIFYYFCPQCKGSCEALLKRPEAFDPNEEEG